MNVCLWRVLDDDSPEDEKNLRGVINKGEWKLFRS